MELHQVKGALTMRRCLKFALVAIVVAGFVAAVSFEDEGGRASANYHSDPLICSDCHVMHASDSGGVTTYNGGAGFTNLLKATNTNTLCLNCHSADGPNYASSGAPCVADKTTGGDTPAAGGFGFEGYGYYGAGVGVYDRVSGGNDWIDTRGHNLHVAAAAQPSPPGSGGGNWDNGTNYMTCATCHNQHGNTNYRNLLPDPNSVNAGISGCTVLAQSNGYTDTSVWEDTGQYTADFTLYCQDCHEKFGPSNTFDPSTQNIQGAVTGNYDADGLVDNSAGANTHHPVDFQLTAAVQTNYTNYGGSGTYPLLTTSSGNKAVFCLTCHRAHGSFNVASLRLRPDTGTLAGAPEACEVCHNKKDCAGTARGNILG